MVQQDTRLYTLTAYLDVTILSYEKEDYRQECLKMIQQLCNLGCELPIPFVPYGVFNFSIEYLNKEGSKEENLLKSIAEKKVMNIKNLSKFLSSDLIKIQLKDIEILSKVPEVIKEEMKEIDFNIFDSSEEQNLNEAIIYEIFNKRIQDIIFAANLSNFGSISVHEYVIFQNSEVYPIGGEGMNYKTFFEAKRKSLEWNYPPLIEIDLAKVWGWLIKREDFLKGFSQTSTTRALINLLEVSHSDVNMKLFRAVMGIEGLYTKGKNNLMEQVREKTQIILGPQENFKKLYSNMYNFRSKYIHGELNFPAKVNIDFSDSMLGYTNDLTIATYFAILILGASIQYLIVSGWQGLEFSYQVTDFIE